VEEQQPAPRHARRRANRAARAAFDEARRAGLVQRHLMKLHHLAAPPYPGLTAALEGPGAPETERPPESEAA
jgi:hypothetical protein